MTECPCQNRKLNNCERIVREVCRKPFFRTGPEYTYMVCVAIIRCSWTTRAYTYLYRHMLQTGFSTTGKRVLLNTLIDEILADEIQESRPPGRHITCCDVEGVDYEPRRVVQL